MHAVVLVHDTDARTFLAPLTFAEDRTVHLPLLRVSDRVVSVVEPFELSPTDMQRVPKHDTAQSTLVPDGLGAVTLVQAVPVQSSTKTELLVHPTAMQNLVELQRTPTSSL